MMFVKKDLVLRHLLFKLATKQLIVKKKPKTGKLLDVPVVTLMDEYSLKSTTPDLETDTHTSSLHLG